MRNHPHTKPVTPPATGSVTNLKTSVKDPEELLTTDQIMHEFNKSLFCSKRSLESWRSIYDETGKEKRIGPKWIRYGLDIIRYKRKDVIRYINGLDWEGTLPRTRSEIKGEDRKLEEQLQ